MPRKKKSSQESEVDKELEGFDIRINEFGEIITTLDIDRLNEFLNRKVDDKKLRERHLKDLETPAGEEE